MPNDTIDVEAMQSFANLAARGAHRGASAGEQIANRLAKALFHIGDDFALLDPDAIEGAFDLMRCMSGPWPTDAAKSAVFDLVAKAAGKVPTETPQPCACDEPDPECLMNGRWVCHACNKPFAA